MAALRAVDTADPRLELALNRARALLQPEETELPVSVTATVQMLVQRNLWFKLSRNPKVLSCRDAASRRRRVGHVGISLADELRSYVAHAAAANDEILVLFHCRGDANFDFDLAKRHPRLNGLTISKADVKELSARELGYGLINPFVAPQLLGTGAVEVIQIFDPGILESSGEAGTMMTNAGDFTWAVEFDPAELVNSEPRLGFVAPIAVREVDEGPMPTIGILTGNAPESGALLWRKLNAGYRRTLGEMFHGDVSYPRVLVHSLPAMGLSMELSDRDRFLEHAIEAEIRAMTVAGAMIVGFACNTTQYYVHKFNREGRFPGIELVSLPDAVERWARSRPTQQIYLAGIGHVTERSPWSAFGSILDLPNIVLHRPREARNIEELAYEVKQGLPLGLAYQKLRAVIRASRCEIVLLALTELSIVFDAFPRRLVGSTTIYDAMELYAEHIRCKSVGKISART